MEEKKIKNPQSGDACSLTGNSTHEQGLIEQRDQKLIEDHEKLLIEDKGEITDARTASLSEEIDAVAPERREKHSWFGWWAAAIAAICVIAICLYFGTKDNEIENQKTAQVAAKLKGSRVNTLASARLAAGNVAGKAASSAAATTKGTVNGLANTDVSANYPMATEESIDSKAEQASTVEYLYFFANDQSEIPDNALLDEISAKAAQTGADITITAYASEVGNQNYNDELCKDRAKNLADYFETHGVTADHIKLVNGGQTDKYGAYAYNRRADIVVDYAG